MTFFLLARAIYKVWSNLKVWAYCGDHGLGGIIQFVLCLWLARFPSLVISAASQKSENDLLVHVTAGDNPWKLLRHNKYNSGSVTEINTIICKCHASDPTLLLTGKPSQATLSIKTLQKRVCVNKVKNIYNIYNFLNLNTWNLFGQKGEDVHSLS